MLGFRRVDVVFEDSHLAEVDADASKSAGHGEAVDKKFRQRMDVIREADDERDFHAIKALHYEKLKGARKDEHSMRLNDQWRLVVRLEGEAPHKRVVIVGIEDYH